MSGSSDDPVRSSGSEEHAVVCGASPLAEFAVELLAASLDYRSALRSALARAIPDFADWGVIDYYAADGELAAVYSGNLSAREEQLVLAIRRRYRSERGENGDVLSALRSDEALLYPDMSKIASVRLSADEQELLDELDLRSSVVVPMQLDGQPLGVLSFISKHRRYDESDLASAQALAAGCAEVLSEVGKQDQGEASLTLLDALYAEAPVGLAFVDRDGRFRRVNNRLAAMNGVPVAAHLGRTFTEALGAVGESLVPFYLRALQQRELVSHELEGRTASDPGVVHHWQVSFMPVQLDGKVLGVSAVAHDITERKRSESHTAFLARTGEILDSTLDYRLTLESVARLAVPEIADWCSISMLNEHGEMRRLAVAHPDPAKDLLAKELIDRETLPADAPAGAPMATRRAQTQSIADFTDELLVRSLRDRRSQEIIRELGIGSMISVPLIARGQTLGAISLIGEQRARFDQEDVRLAEALASRVAVNIDNARLYTEHTRIARTLQAGLMPRALPHVPGLDLAARYRPAGELIEVGGDFYDVYLRPSEDWMVVIGDVTGKGAEAAATTALVRYTLRAAAQHPRSPSELLQDLNAAMIDQQADYCTIGLVSIRAAEDGPCEATICLGGHPAPILLRPNGEAKAVGAAGTLLGFVPDANFPETHVSLDVGETLLLYTDGLTEASAPPGWSEAELENRLSGCATDDLDGLLAKLEAEAIAGARGRPRDDIALLAVGRRSLA